MTWSGGSRIRVVRPSDCIVSALRGSQPGWPAEGLAAAGVTPSSAVGAEALAARAAYEAAVRNKLRRQLRRKETLTMKSSSSRLARVPFPIEISVTAANGGSLV